MAMVTREGKIKGGGSWLYWVAAMSAFNMIAVMANWDFQFSIGLGFTSLVGYLAKNGGPAAVTVTTMFTGLVIVLLAALGYYACRGQIWAFVVGIIVLVGDTLLLLLGLPDTAISVAIHVWAVISLIGGARAAAQPS